MGNAVLTPLEMRTPPHSTRATQLLGHTTTAQVKRKLATKLPCRLRPQHQHLSGPKLSYSTLQLSYPTLQLSYPTLQQSKAQQPQHLARQQQAPSSKLMSATVISRQKLTIVAGKQASLVQLAPRPLSGNPGLQRPRKRSRKSLREERHNATSNGTGLHSRRALR